MNLKWGTAILYIGIALISQSARCDAGSRVAVSDPQTLAKQTGAAHFEEHYEPIESSEESGEHRLRKRASDEDFDYEVYQGVVGRPGIDFPIHARIPQTSFSCRQYGNGYFADLETDCQVFHICDDGRKISFLCPNGTIFQQPELICDWWFKVNCGKSPGFYADSAELLSRSSGRRKNHQRIENEYSSDKKSGFGSSYKSKGTKSQYPLKSSRRYEESDRLNQAKIPDRRIDSEESVSVESIDFEDITEGTRTYHRKSDKFQLSKPPRDNDQESQVVAESASFVSNNGRDNGYTYDNPSSNKKSQLQISSNERGYSREVTNQQQRQKNDRGRQKYDFRNNVYKNLNQPKQSEQFIEATTTTTTTAEPLVFQRFGNNGESYQNNRYNGNSEEIFQRNGNENNGGAFQKSGYNGNNGGGYQYNGNNGNGNTGNGNNGNGNNGNKGTFFDRSQSRFSTPRPNGGYTTARRFDVTKTTPYYTPTVPTVNSRFGEYKSTSTSTTVKTGFTPIISTPNPFSQRKGAVQNQPSDRFNFGNQNDYTYQKPSSFRAPPSTTPGSIRTTYFTSDGRRPAVDIRLINGTVTSTPAYYSTTQQSPAFTTSGYDYSPFSTIPPNSGDRSQPKLSSPAPFSVFASGERTSSPVDVIIENHFESKKQNPSQSGFSTPFTSGRTENVEILKKDDPTRHDVKIETTTGLPVEAVTGSGFISSGNNEIEKLVATSGYAYQTPSTPGPVTSTSNYGYSTVSTDFTTTGSPAQNTPSKSEIETEAAFAFDFKRNTFKNGVNRFESTTSISLQSTTGGFSTQGFATSTYSPPVSTYFPTSYPTPTSTISPSPSTTLISDNPAPTTYRPSITTAQPSVDDHVKGMIKTLNDLNIPVKVGSRAGLDIPSSSGPDTLHSLAEYFASEESTSTTEANALADDNVSGDDEEKDAAVKADLSGSNLTGKTVHKYKNLFGLSTTTPEPEPTLSPRFQPDIAPDTIDLEGQHSSGLLVENIGKPETRKLAQVFTNALSAYLQDPDSFRKVLTEVRPTEPPITVDTEFNQGTAASYLPTGSTSAPTVSPFSQVTTLRTGEGLEVLDFSDVTGASGSQTESSTLVSTTASNDISTTQDPISTNYAAATAIPNYVNKVPASTFIAESLRKKALDQEQSAKLQTGTEENVFPDEINTGLGLSTVEPYLSLAESIAARKSSVDFGFFNTGFSTTQRDGYQGDLSTTTSPPASVAFELLPPSGESDFNLDEDEEALQRAQSQSFVTARNNLNRLEAKGKRFESLKLSTTNAPRTDSTKQFHFITRLMTDTPTTTEVPDYKKGTVTPWPATTAFAGFVDPLTINDGLTVRADIATTTASPHTYLPRSTPSQATPIHVDVDDLGQSGTSTIRTFLHPDIPEEVLPRPNGIQRIANKMFGNLDPESANHLMSVMKKAESNETVRKLILLLIQTCDDDYGKTVEQSRKILLNALIGMDQKLSGNEEVKVYKLQPERESKSINLSSRSQNLIASTVQPQITTTYQSGISTTVEYESGSTAQPNSAEVTTKPLVHVADPGEGRHGSTFKPTDIESSTIASTAEPSVYSTTDAVNVSPTTIRPQSSRRRTKDVNDSIGLPGAESDLSHKSSDERALELLKSLYSLASKFSRR